MIQEQQALDARFASLGWLVVTTLISWNLYTTNKLQIEVAEISKDFGYLGKQLLTISVADKECEIRLNDLEGKLVILERTVDRFTSERNNNKER